MLKIDQIRRVQIELTTRCNARCPMCMRNYRGLEFNSGYPDTELSLEDIQHILPPEFLQQLSRGVLFNGNLGDFGVARDALKIVDYLSDNVKSIRIHTNGSMRTPAWWAQLARPEVTVGFALDGLADTHHLYRQDTDWHTVINNARAFIQAGGNAVWRFISFDHNLHQEEECRRLSKELGFSKFENISDGRDRGPVFTRSGKFSHYLGTPDANQTAVPDVKPMIENHLTWFDPATVKISKDIPSAKIICRHKSSEEIYIAADGTVWPCCFLAWYPDTMHHPGNSQLAPLVAENNALKYDLAHCMDWFDRVEQTWAKNSIAEGRLYGCVSTCGDV